MTKRGTYTGYKDKYNKALRVGDKVYCYVDYLGYWARGEIVSKDDIYRVSHSFGIEIMNDEVVKKIRKISNERKNKNRKNSSRCLRQ